MLGSMKIYLAFALAAILSLSFLNIIQPQHRLLWQLSVLSKEFGHYFVLLSIALFAFALTIDCGRNGLLLWSVVSAALFLRPLVSATMNEAQWRQELQSAFGDSAIAQSSLLNYWQLWFGRTHKVAFVRHKLNNGELSFDLYPAQKAADSLAPVVIVIHGGGWDSGNSEQVPELNSRLAQVGYNVVAANYRLAPEFKWPAQKEDILSLIAHLKENATEFKIDMSRYVLLGRSAGGQIASALAYSSADPALRGLITFYPPTDMVFGYEVAEEHDLIESRQLLRDFLGGNPYEQMSNYVDASAVNKVSKHSCPTLLLHGRPDTLTWYKHSERLHARLKAAGISSAFILMDWAPHGFDYNINGPGGQISTRAIEHFLTRVF